MLSRSVGVPSLLVAGGGSLKHGSGLRAAPEDAAASEERLRPIEQASTLPHGPDIEAPNQAGPEKKQKVVKPAKYSKPCNILDSEGKFVQDWVVIPVTEPDFDGKYIVAKRDMDNEDGEPMMDIDEKPVLYEDIDESVWSEKVDQVRTAQMDRYKEINFQPVDPKSKNPALTTQFIEDECQRLIPKFKSVGIRYKDGAVQPCLTKKEAGSKWETMSDPKYAVIKNDAYGWLRSPFRSNNVTAAQMRYLNGIATKQDLNITVPSSTEKLMGKQLYESLKGLATRPPSNLKDLDGEFVQQFVYDMDLDSIVPRGWREQHKDAAKVPMPPTDVIESLKATFAATTSHFRKHYAEYYFLDPTSEAHTEWLEEMEQVDEDAVFDSAAEATRVIPAFNQFGIMTFADSDDPKKKIYKNMGPGESDDNIIRVAYDMNTRDYPGKKKETQNLAWARSRYAEWKRVGSKRSIDYLWPTKEPKVKKEKDPNKPKKKKKVSDPNKPPPKPRKQFEAIDQNESDIRQRYYGALRRVGERRKYRRSQKVGKVNRLIKKGDPDEKVKEFLEQWERTETEKAKEENDIIEPLRVKRREQIDAIEDADEKKNAIKKDMEDLSDLYPSVLLREARKIYEREKKGKRGKARLEAQIRYLQTLSPALRELEDAWLRQNREKALERKRANESLKLSNLTSERRADYEKKIAANIAEDEEVEKEFYRLLGMTQEERETYYASKKQKKKVERTKVETWYWSAPFAERVAYDDKQRADYARKNPEKVGVVKTKTSFAYMRSQIDLVKNEEDPASRYGVYKDFYTTLNGLEGRPGGRKRTAKKKKKKKGDSPDGDDDDDDDGSEDEDYSPEKEKEQKRIAKLRAAAKKAGKSKEELDAEFGSTEANKYGIQDKAKRKAYENALGIVLQRELRVEYNEWKKKYEISLLTPEEREELDAKNAYKEFLKRYEAMTPEEKKVADTEELNRELESAEIEREQAWQTVLAELYDEAPPDATENERFNVAWDLTKIHVIPVDRRCRDTYYSYYSNEKNWNEEWTAEYFKSKCDRNSEEWKKIMENRKIDLLNDARFQWSSALVSYRTRIHKNAPLVRQFNEMRKQLNAQIAEAEEKGETDRVEELKNERTKLNERALSSYQADTYDSRVKDSTENIVKHVFQLQNAIQEFLSLKQNGTEGSANAVPDIVENIKQNSYSIPIPTIEEVIVQESVLGLVQGVLTEEYQQKLVEVKEKERLKKEKARKKQQDAADRVREDRADLDVTAAEILLEGDDSVVVSAEMKDKGELEDYADLFDEQGALGVRARQDALLGRFSTEENDDTLTVRDIQDLWRLSKAKKEGLTFEQYYASAFDRYNVESNEKAQEMGTKQPDANPQRVLAFLLQEAGSAWRRQAARQEFSVNTSGDYVDEFIRTPDGRMVFFDDDGNEYFSRDDAPVGARGREVPHIKILKENLDDALEENPKMKSVIVTIPLWPNHYFVRKDDENRTPEQNRYVEIINEKVRFLKTSFRTSDFPSDEELKDYQYKGLVTIRDDAVTLNVPQIGSTPGYRKEFADFLKYVRNNVIKRGAYGDDSKQKDDDDDDEQGKLGQETEFRTDDEGSESEEEEEQQEVLGGVDPEKLASYGDSSGLAMHRHEEIEDDLLVDEDEAMIDDDGGLESEEENEVIVPDGADSDEEGSGDDSGDDSDDDAEAEKDEAADMELEDEGDDEEEEEAEESDEEEGSDDDEDGDSDDASEEDDQDEVLPGAKRKQPPATKASDSPFLLSSQPAMGLTSRGYWGGQEWWKK